MFAGQNNCHANVVNVGKTSFKVKIVINKLIININCFRFAQVKKFTSSA